MKFRGTLIWIAVFAALAAYVGLVELPSGKKEQEQKARAQKLLLFKEADVEALTLQRQGETIEIKRIDTDAWRIEQPLTADASFSAVDQLIYELENATHTRVVDEAPEDVSPYGLGTPRLTLTVHLKDGPTQTLELGDESPIGHARYAKVGGEAPVYLTQLDMRLVDKSANDLRDRTLFAFQTAKVKRFTVNYQGEVQTFSREGDAWYLSGKVNGLADADEVMNLLGTVQSSSIQKFIDETPQDLQQYGLENPRIVFTARLEDAGEGKTENTTVTLRLGTPHERQDDQYYAQRAETGNVFTVHASLYNTLSRNFITFRDKKLFTFEEDQVAAVTIQNENETVALKRDAQSESGWTLTQPERGEVDTAAVNSLLFDLKDVRVEEFVGADNLKLFGLADPTRVVTVTPQKGDAVSVRLGNPNRKKDLYFAQRTSDGAVFALGQDAVEKLFRSLHDLRNKKLMNVDEQKVAGIVLDYPDRRFELIRKEDAWSLNEPETIEHVPAHVGKGILWTLNNLEFATRVDPENPPEDAGLKTPALNLSVRGKDQKSLARITVGKPAGDGLHYARVEGRPGLYRIKSRFLDEIPGTLDRFRAKDS